MSKIMILLKCTTVVAIPHTSHTTAAASLGTVPFLFSTPLTLLSAYLPWVKDNSIKTYNHTPQTKEGSLPVHTRAGFITEKSIYNKQEFITNRNALRWHFSVFLVWHWMA